MSQFIGRMKRDRPAMEHEVGQRERKKQRRMKIEMPKKGSKHSLYGHVDANFIEDGKGNGLSGGKSGLQESRSLPVDEEEEEEEYDPLRPALYASSLSSASDSNLSSVAKMKEIQERHLQKKLEAYRNSLKYPRTLSCKHSEAKRWRKSNVAWISKMKGKDLQRMGYALKWRSTERLDRVGGDIVADNEEEAEEREEKDINVEETIGKKKRDKKKENEEKTYLYIKVEDSEPLKQYDTSTIPPVRYVLGLHVEELVYLVDKRMMTIQDEIDEQGYSNERGGDGRSDSNQSDGNLIGIDGMASGVGRSTVTRESSTHLSVQECYEMIRRDYGCCYTIAEELREGEGERCVGCKLGHPPPLKVLAPVENVLPSSFPTSPSSASAAASSQSEQQHIPVTYVTNPRDYPPLMHTHSHLASTQYTPATTPISLDHVSAYMHLRRAGYVALRHTHELKSNPLPLLPPSFALPRSFQQEGESQENVTEKEQTEKWKIFNNRNGKKKKLFDYDIYDSTSFNGKKECGPDHHLLLERCCSAPPPLSSLASRFESTNQQPYLVGIMDQGTVSFLRMYPPPLPPPR